jgi:PKD repeat protein
MAYTYQYTTLIFSTEFADTELVNGDLDPADWIKYNNGPGSTRDPALITASGSAMHIATHDAVGSGVQMRWNTRPQVPYGRWEMSVRVSSDTTHGFAFLLWPDAVDWPVGGEIDIGEYSHDRAKENFTVHYSATNKTHQYSFTPTLAQGGNFTNYHTIATEWTPTAVYWIVDGVLQATMTDPAAIPPRKMSLRLQAGADVGTGGATTSIADVDWVKYYRSVPPTAAFTAGGVSGTVANFDASAVTVTPPATVKSYAWNFGDGTTGLGQPVQHAYPAAGTYTVTLTVTDSNLDTSVLTQSVTITGGSQGGSRIGTNAAGRWVRAQGAGGGAGNTITYVNNQNGTLTVFGGINNQDGTVTLNGTGFTDNANGTVTLI